MGFCCGLYVQCSHCCMAAHCAQHESAPVASVFASTVQPSDALHGAHCDTVRVLLGHAAMGDAVHTTKYIARHNSFISWPLRP